jgi:hypothetical protein
MWRLNTPIFGRSYWQAGMQLSVRINPAPIREALRQITGETFALCGCTAAAARSANQLPLVTSVSFWSRSVGGARSMLGQHRDDDIARVEQDGFLFVRRDLDEAKSSEQENSFNSQQCVTDFMHIATFRSKRIE